MKLKNYNYVLSELTALPYNFKLKNAKFNEYNEKLSPCCGVCDISFYDVDPSLGYRLECVKLTILQSLVHIAKNVEELAADVIYNTSTLVGEVVRYLPYGLLSLSFGYLFFKYINCDFLKINRNRSKRYEHRGKTLQQKRTSSNVRFFKNSS